MNLETNLLDQKPNKAQQSLPLVAGTVKTLRFFAVLCVRRYAHKVFKVNYEAY